MRQIGFGLCILFSAVFAPAQQDEPARTWVVSKPYANNPLREVTLRGNTHFAGKNTSAELQLDCHPAVGIARVNLQVPTSGIAFDFSPFEGPGGIGEKRKLVTFAIANTSAAHHCSGYFVEANEFVFSFPLSKAESNELTSGTAAGQQAVITVQSVKAGEAGLSTVFRLPNDNAPARKAIAACLANLQLRHKN